MASPLHSATPQQPDSTDDVGALLWLPRISGTTAHVVAPTSSDPTSSATISIARHELLQSWQGGNVTLRLISDDKLGEGFVISYKAADHSAVVSAHRPIGLLYGSYALLRWQSTSDEQHADTSWSSVPALQRRMLNHWDNPDGSVERGYAGRSIWKWEQVTKNGMTDSLRQRLTIYARANASVGINATVVNNVNASPVMVTRPYLEKLQVIADLLRPYGIQVWLSINFGSPLALHETKTADPLDITVQRWWQRKAKEIYKLIPDFGGFLVKANSEGQPGPGDYHRSHADGANMLADALKPYGGTVIWRSFVYGANHKGEDRVMQAVSEFKPMDGLFHDNVILQSKNGPLDFQPREPYAPIFDNMTKTQQMAELQIAHEYTGQALHLVYLAPMWKEFFSYVDPVKRGLKGIAGVANTGDDTNWCGHPFSQSNWYAFGRLAWDPSLTSEQIAHEWLLQTFGRGDSVTIAALEDMMLTSREACVDYMMPLGLHHIFAGGHHYGPEPWCNPKGWREDWLPRFYHRADTIGIGFNRTDHDEPCLAGSAGSNNVAQYPEPLRTLYNNIGTCPENLLLWFHHVKWDYTMSNGLSLWDNLCYSYDRGVRQAREFVDTWMAVKPYVKEDVYQRQLTRFQRQAKDAQWWRDACLLYFQTFANRPLPPDCPAPVHKLDDLMKYHLDIDNYTSAPIEQLP